MELIRFRIRLLYRHFDLDSALKLDEAVYATAVAEVEGSRESAG